MKNRYIPFFLLIGFISIAGTCNQKSGPYCNSRYNFCLTYPNEILTQAKTSANGDGVVLSSKDGATKVEIFGENNVDNKSFRDLWGAYWEVLNETYPKASIEYRNNMKDEYSWTYQLDGNWTAEKLYFFDSEFARMKVKMNTGDRPAFDSLVASLKLTSTKK